MKFEAKTFKLGNSVAVYIPKSVYEGIKVGEVYTFDLLQGEKESEVYTKPLITEKQYIRKEQDRWWCHKHEKWNVDCGCK